MESDYRIPYRPRPRAPCAVASHAWHLARRRHKRTTLRPQPRKGSAAPVSLFPSLGRLHAEHHIVVPRAAPRIDRSNLLGETFRAHYHLILRALRHAYREFAARIGPILPMHFLFARAANVQFYSRKREGFVGENSTADQKVICMAIL